MAAGFYEQVGAARWASTAATVGPWSPDSQHGGPPSALLTRTMEACEPDPAQRMARVCIDILRPVPVAPLDVRVRVVRPGRRVTLLEAVAEAGGTEVVHARGWRIATAAPGSGPPAVPDGGVPAPLPGDTEPVVWAGARTEGYMGAVECRFVTGGFEQPGPAAAWMRSAIPLVAGEDTSPACRVMLLADSGNGVSGTLDVQRWLFVNVDLVVALHRLPEGEWVLLDAVTTVDPAGVGLTTTTLSDRRGRIGRGLQTLVVARRDG